MAWVGEQAMGRASEMRRCVRWPAGGDGAAPLARALVIRALVGLAFAVSLQLGAAWACTPLPNTLTNGTTADATQVMGDFNGILGCPLFTGPVGIDTTTPAVLLDTTGSPASDSPGTQDVLHLTRPELSGTSWPQVVAFQVGTYNTAGACCGPDTRLDINLKAATGDTLTGDTNVMTLLSNGNVGVGTTAPDAQLSLGNALNTVKVAAYDSGNASFLFGMGVNAGELTFGAGIAANGTPGMVLTDGGRVGIATTSPGFTLEVDGSTWSTTGWSSASDGRLKQGVTTIPDALGTIERLRGVEFYWRPPSERAVGKTLALPLGEQQVGFVAQEVEKVVPEAVSTPAAGSDSPYGVNEAKIVAILVEAVKEQQVEIDQLKAQIAAARK